MDKFDVIIIGSGLGGLECAALLAKEGMNVCVLEKNPLIGGCLQSFPRHGYQLDTGIHYIGSLDQGQILHQYFHYLGVMDRLSLRRMDDNGYDKVFYRNRLYDFAMGEERFIETLTSSFPHQRENLRTYTDIIRKSGKIIDIEKLKKGIFLSQESLNYFSISAAETIRGTISDSELRQILAGTALLYGGKEETSTLYEHGVISYSYLEGAYRCKGGSMQIANELAKRIQEAGGTVRSKAKVTRILVENETAYGVEVNGEEVIRGRYILSDIHPQGTYALLEKNRSVKKAFISRINHLENSYGFFTLYLLMKQNTCPYLNHNIYIHTGDNVWYDPSIDHGRTTHLMISMQAPIKDDRFTEVISVHTPMYMDELLKWEHTEPEQRGEDYLLFKKRKEAQIIQVLHDHGYDWDKEALFRFTTTPLSYRDYTGTVDGSAYGFNKDFHNPTISFISPKSKLNHLYLTGQNINVHGVLGVTLTSILTCGMIVGLEYLTKKIGNA